MLIFFIGFIYRFCKDFSFSSLIVILIFIFLGFLSVTFIFTVLRFLGSFILIFMVLEEELELELIQVDEDSEEELEHEYELEEEELELEYSNHNIGFLKISS